MAAVSVRCVVLALAGLLAVTVGQDVSCCFDGGCGETCMAGAGGDAWCGQSMDQCVNSCNGQWCLGGDASADSAQEQAEVAGMCCYYPKEGDVCTACQSSDVGEQYCAKSAKHCEGECGGKWCGARGESSLPNPSVPTTPSQPQTPVPSESFPPGPSGPVGGPSTQTPPGTLPPPASGPLAPGGPVGGPPTQFPPGPSGNPFAGYQMYVNPTFQANIQASIQTAAPGAERQNLEILSTVPSAYWLDTMSKVQPGDDATTETAAGILKDAVSQSPVPLVTFIVYDLPNRDCAAKASNGEICCGGNTPEGPCDHLDAASTGFCEEGLATYMSGYIDKLATIVNQYCEAVPMALVIEPDSLPNLVTNSGNPKCGSTATAAAYRGGVIYAVKTLKAACPRASIYVDAAHGGWLGWPDNLNGFAAEIAGLGIQDYLRGFSLNVANYQPLGIRCPQVGFCLNNQNPSHPCCYDPCNLSTEWNPGHSELNYAPALRAAMQAAMPGFEPYFIIDTGRNGQSPRQSCANWCNARGAGAGLLPTLATGDPSIDAYLWLKTPGESDGCTQTLPSGDLCPRFDASCASIDSIGSAAGEPYAPEAGAWFDYQVKMLARNAVLQ